MTVLSFIKIMIYQKCVILHPNICCKMNLERILSREAHRILMSCEAGYAGHTLLSCLRYTAVQMRYKCFNPYKKKSRKPFIYRDFRVL